MCKTIGTTFSFITKVSLWSSLLPEKISQEETQVNRPTKDRKPVLLQIRASPWLRWQSTPSIARILSDVLQKHSHVLSSTCKRDSRKNWDQMTVFCCNYVTYFQLFISFPYNVIHKTAGRPLLQFWRLCQWQRFLQHSQHLCLPFQKHLCHHHTWYSTESLGYCLGVEF